MNKKHNTNILIYFFAEVYLFLSPSVLGSKKHLYPPVNYKEVQKSTKTLDKQGGFPVEATCRKGNKEVTVSGRIYNRRKKTHGNEGGVQDRTKLSPQFEDLKTSAIVANELGVSKATFERNGQRAESKPQFDVLNTSSANGLHLTGNEVTKCDH